jgi:hypothetical protein
MKRWIVELGEYQYAGIFGGTTISKKGARRCETYQEAEYLIRSYREKTGLPFPHARIVEVEEVEG